MAFADDPSAATLNMGLKLGLGFGRSNSSYSYARRLYLLESGSTRMKNAGHIAGKTIFTLGLCTLVYWAVGYAIRIRSRQC